MLSSRNAILMAGSNTFDMASIYSSEYVGLHHCTGVCDGPELRYMLCLLHIFYGPHGSVSLFCRPQVGIEMASKQSSPICPYEDI